MKKTLLMLMAIMLSLNFVYSQDTLKRTKHYRTWGAWPYKGFIGITPVYAGSQTSSPLALGFGADGEFALPRILSFRGGFFRNYFEIDKSGKRGYMTDFGINFHPIEWFGRATFTDYAGKESDYEVSYDGGRTWSGPIKGQYKYNYFKDMSIKRICFRGGMLNYRFNYEDEKALNMYYVESKTMYAGLSFYKLALSTGARREIGADAVFQTSVDVPARPAISDTCTMRTGFRVYYARFGETGGGTFEMGVLPGLNSKTFYYFRASLSIRPVFVKGFRFFSKKK